MIAGILMLSIALQFVAALMAFRLIRLTGERWAWGFISAAILLMTVRRGTSLFHMLANGEAYKADAVAEVIALAISVLMVIGMARIAPVFRSIKQAKEDAQRAEKQVRTLKEVLEVRVVQRTAQLEAANKELEAFSYSVSHDLRAPLRAINGFSHVLQEEYSNKLDEEGKRLLNVVRDNAARMGQLIDDILRFSHAGRLEINYSEIDMEKMAHAVTAELMATDPSSWPQMEIEPIPPAFGDSAMMRQVLVNLISNAIKFSRTNATPKIKVGSSKGEDETIYFVKDNGVGFDMQYAGKLFGVFQRLHSENEFEGTGVGLAIVKSIVARHGGRVWAEGKVGEGATIYFALPINGQVHV